MSKLKGDYQMMKFIALGAVSVFTVMLLLELMAGCGQVTYLPDRTWRSNECVFISYDIQYGRW
jgi:hypothetical protein